VEGSLVNRPFVRLVLCASGLSAALWVLHQVSVDAPGAPTPTEPTLLVMTGLRDVALVAGWYLVAVTAAGAVARLARVRPLVRALDGLTLPPVRRLLDTSLGLSMLATAVAAPPAWAEPPSPEREQPPVTMRRLSEDPPHEDHLLREPPTTAPPTSTSTTATPISSTTTLSAPPTTEASLVETTTTTTSAPTTTTTTPPATHPPRIEVAEPPAPPPVPSGGEWTVQPGDHFWSIAERLLTRAWGRPPSDAETDPYWRQLVEANRDRLADRANPDLLFVGQVLGIPPPPAPP
jgi:nucleoid-associated protein YgaU